MEINFVAWTSVKSKSFFSYFFSSAWFSSVEWFGKSHCLASSLYQTNWNSGRERERESWNEAKQWKEGTTPAPVAEKKRILKEQPALVVIRRKFDWMRTMYFWLAPKPIQFNIVESWVFTSLLFFLSFISFLFSVNHSVHSLSSLFPLTILFLFHVSLRGFLFR